MGGGNQTAPVGFYSGKSLEIGFFVKYQEYVITLIIYQAYKRLKAIRVVVRDDAVGVAWHSRLFEKIEDLADDGGHVVVAVFG